ncbi:peptidoglycan-recognition protein LF-like isoform X2 [Macrosteles quadrilineatus]|uniref:peptidoglycan-recognition protein LF-like isoform X2 n=1 Tax=Macrosteles quadrilineatus TaxID=74068 RepID=UPI0023E33089|nr:peptidoglycan-recognition protein LF-like isoform X2 [Macrosteles quadrilineatus]
MLNSVKKYPHPVIKYISREQWGARPPKTPPENLKIPVLTLHVYDTRTKDCKTKEECMKTVQDLQNEYMFYRGFDDIPWNFLIGKDGNIYEGRGFKVKPIKTDLDHPRQKKWDGKSIDVAYIGDYRRSNPKLKVKLACDYLYFILDDKKHITFGRSKLEDFTMTPEKNLVED